MTVRPKLLQANKLQGATLVELIITIVIISVSLTGILSVVNLTTSHSADPMVQHQATAIAESYLEEILLQNYNDPETPLNPYGSDTGESRPTFDDVDDYHALSDTGAKDQSGNALAGLGNYIINITVNAETVSTVAMKKITVSVTRPGTQNIVLIGYRADY